MSSVWTCNERVLMSHQSDQLYGLCWLYCSTQDHRILWSYSPKSMKKVQPHPGLTHTSPAAGVGVQGGNCNINSSLYYVLICISSWLLHMTCPVISIALASHFLISQSLSNEVFLFLGAPNFDELFWRSNKRLGLAAMDVPSLMWCILLSKHDIYPHERFKGNQ